MRSKRWAPSRPVVNLFSLAVIAAAMAAAVALLVLNLSNWTYYAGTVSGIAYHFALPSAIVLALAFAFRLPADGRAALALSLFAVVPALYLAEAYLTQRAKTPPAGDTAAFDGRAKIDVIRDLRRDGADAYPAMRARAMLVDGADGKLASALAPDGPLPLASLPGAVIVSCNESGTWMTFDADRHGFHNPDDAAVWDGPPPALALIGDSFTQGDCVASDANIAAHLSRRFGTVLNLGVAGHGPLSELAALKEYAALRRPKVVAWLYFEGNDLFKDLPEEKRSALMRYLEPGFSQELAANRETVARRFRAYLDAETEAAMARVDDPNLALLDFLKLFYLRETFGLDPVGLGIVPAVTANDLDLFRRTLDEARRAVEGWGGRLVFVYMSDSPRYFAAPRHSRIRDRVRAQVLDIARGLDLPIIDVHVAIAKLDDPESLYFYPGSHFNERGYAVAADAIRAGLRGLDVP